MFYFVVFCSQLCRQNLRLMVILPYKHVNSLMLKDLNKFWNGDTIHVYLCKMDPYMKLKLFNPEA
jgi:hypothetical protein